MQNNLQESLISGEGAEGQVPAENRIVGGEEGLPTYSTIRISIDEETKVLVRKTLLDLYEHKKLRCDDNADGGIREFHGGEEPGDDDKKLAIATISQDYESVVETIQRKIHPDLEWFDEETKFTEDEDGEEGNSSCPEAKVSVNDVLQQLMAIRGNDSTSYKPIVPSLCEPFAPVTFKRGMQRNLCMINITMYNEDKEEMVNTLGGIFEGVEFIRELADQKSASPHSAGGLVFGRTLLPDDMADQFMINIIADGRSKFNTSTSKEWLTEEGIYDDSVIKTGRGMDCPPENRRDETVQCHVFEGQYQSSMQVLLAIKEHNKGKQDSQLWFFNKFCDHYMPETVLLVDVGTRPCRTSIFRLLRAMADHSEFAGVCGEIGVEKEAVSMFPWFTTNAPFLSDGPLVTAAQIFEYRSANFIDKALESFFGYISVLPGAFSGYKFAALKDDKGSGHTPLDEYFKEVHFNADQAELIRKVSEAVDQCCSNKKFLEDVRKDPTKFGLSGDDGDAFGELLDALRGGDGSDSAAAKVEAAAAATGGSPRKKKTNARISSVFGQFAKAARRRVQYKKTMKSKRVHEILLKSPHFCELQPAFISLWGERAQIYQPYHDVATVSHAQRTIGEKQLMLADVFEKNMYLAEDRVLCFELVAKGHLLHYCKDAVAQTDVPKSLCGDGPNLIKQRRRWYNGSFFATGYGLLRTPKQLLLQSSHSQARKILFTIQFVYNCLQYFSAFLMPSLFFLGLQMTLMLTFPNSIIGNFVTYVALCSCNHPTLCVASLQSPHLACRVAFLVCFSLFAGWCLAW
jgi:cellulose synthase/poly-beta-1,6-N-acetylglucosamine synthase-like glycosyltransferase